MSERKVKGLPDADGRLAQAVEWFLRVRSESACVEDLPELRRWIESDRENALAYQQVAATWIAVGTHASAPEFVIGRRDALEDSRKAGRHRWSARRLSTPGAASGLFGRVRSWAIAASAVLALVVGLEWWVAQRSNVYATDLGERRSLTLQDGSVVTLDARSRVRVRYTKQERWIALEQGQARFAVAKDQLRPFRVRARDQTVLALGTQFNVELVASSVLVTLIEGHVAVAGVEEGKSSEIPTVNQGEAHNRHEEGHQKSDDASPRVGNRKGIIELTAGEGLRIRQDGHAVRLAHVDLDRATAWQSGKMFFDNEPLSSAAERVNRYARRQIEIDPSVAGVGISGVFNAGDTDAFVEAVTVYFPVQIDSTNGSDIRLTARK